MASFLPSSGSPFFRRQAKKKPISSRKRGWKSQRPLLAEALEGRWMLDATIVSDTNVYPPSGNPPVNTALATVPFNESETIAPPNGNPTFPPVGSTVNLQTGKIGIFYTDETAMLLGITQATVKTASGTKIISGNVSPLGIGTGMTVTPADPGAVTDPLVGVGAGGLNSTYTYMPNTASLPIQAGTDASGRPVFPSLYVTDITGLSPSSPQYYSGDWQAGATPIAPNAVFGAWKSATETIDETASPPTVTFDVGQNPAQNKWDLGPGADPAPTNIQSQGYGAEAQWNLSSLNLIPGHSYRFYFIVHDGDQNKQGGDVGQAAFDLVSPVTPTIATTTGGNVVLGSGEKLTDSATLSGGNNPTGTITFNLYAPSDTTYSSPVYTTTVPVSSGNGTYSINSTGSTNPGGFLPTVTGNYEWVASYSGDSNNSPVSSGNANEPETVTPAATLTTTPGGTVALAGGNKLTDSATLSGGGNPTGSLTFYLFAPGVMPNADNSNNVYSNTVTVSGDGSYDTSTGTNPGGYLPTASGTYQWVAIFSSGNSSSSILGAAGDFAVLGLRGSNISITNPSTTINGSVGFGPNGTQNFSDGTINGNYQVDTTANNSQSNNVVVTGTTTSTNLSTAANDAISASTAINALAPTQSLGAITNSETIVGNGGVNVIDVSQINLSGSSTITFSGGPNDLFYVNDPGSLQMSGPSAIVLNGVTPNQVIFNATGTGSVQFSGASEAQGIFLAVDRSIDRSNGVVNGALIGGENGSIAITSAAQINYSPPSSITVTSPFKSEPENVVDATIAISPLTPVNPVNSPETFTITVTASPAGTGTPTFGTPTVTFPTGTPGMVGPVTLVSVNGDVATYTETIDSAVTGSFTVRASDTVTMGGVTVTRTTGDSVSGDSRDAVKTYVSAGIAITPLTPVNEVNHAETFTVTETASPLAGQTPTFGTPTITFPSGTPATVGSVSGPTINGDTATFTVSIDNPTAGAFDVKASATITIGGVAITRTTGDGLPGDSPDAVKNYVDANIAISPLAPVNAVNAPETFTITVTALPAATTGAPTFGVPTVTFPTNQGTVGAVTPVSTSGDVATYTVTIDSAVAGSFEVKASDTVSMGGVTVTRTTGDGLTGDSTDAVKTYVTAGITITPPSPVNEVNHAETFTITEMASPLAGQTPTFGTPTITFPSGTPATVGSVSGPTINGDTATFTVSIDNPTAGTFDVKASATITIGGVTVTRSTGDGLPGDSPDAVKNYVDARIAIAPPTPVNEVNHQETFTITVTAMPAATPGTPSFGTPTISFPGATPGTVGPLSGPTIVGDVATYTVSIDNPAAGTFTVQASDSVTMGGVTVTRTTGDNLSGDSASAVKNYVDANIAISPLTPVNAVNHPETFTITVTASPAATGTPSFGTPTITFPSGAPGTVGPLSGPTIVGDVATYTYTINSAVPGTFTVQASDTVTMGGVTVTRTTGDGLSGDSPSAVKTYVGLNITTTPGGTVVLGSGTPLSDTATLTGGNNPTGTVTFYLFAPGVIPNAANSNNVYSDTVMLIGLTASTGSGTIAGSAVPTQAGTYEWVAVYNGDANNSSVSSSFLSEPQIVTQIGPAIKTTPGPTIVFGSNVPLSDTATLTGGNSPTGTITFYLFAPGVAPNATNSNNVYSDVAPLVGGSASTGTGTITGSALPTIVGTYEWVAVYSGDANNQSATSTFGSEPELAASPAAISTFAGPTVTLGSGAKLTDAALLEGGTNPTGTITFYLFAPGVTPNATDSNNVYSNTVTVTGSNVRVDTSTGSNPGGYLPAVAGTYEWVALYSGDANNPPARSEFNDEPEVVNPGAPPSIVTTPGGTVVLGSLKPLSDTATLTGGNTPTGTITFYLFAPGVAPNATNSNNVYSDVVPLAGSSASTGTGTITGSPVPTVIGTYEWVAVYSGDANNPSATSTFGSEGEVVATPPAISTFAGAGITLGSGSPLTDKAVLQNGMNPTGTITFYLFAPNVTPNATNSNNVYSDVVTVTAGNTTYDTSMGNNPGGYLPTVAGTYEWVAIYSGDANNPPAASEFGDEPQKVVPPTPVTPSIVTTPGGTAVLGSGTPLSDTAALSGGNHPTGTVTFYLFAPGVTPNATDSNNAYSDVVPLTGTTASTGAGTSTGSAVPTVIGTYEWVAVYNGDANNNSATSNFGDEPQIVTSQGQAQVVVFKIADQPSIDAGQTAGFTIKILNEGASTATGVTLTDVLPPGVAHDIDWMIDASGSGFGAGTNPADFSITGPVGNQVISLASSISTLAAGASISVHITGQTSLNDVDPNLPPCSTTLVNTATVSAANEPANEQSAQASATITLHNVDLDVSKTADQTQVIAGQIVGFTIQIYNQGCVEAQNVTFSDQLSAGPGNDIFWRLDPTQGSPEYFEIVGQIGQQQLELLPGANFQPGGLISVHIIGQTTINDVGTLNNTVTVNASNEPSFEDNAQASASINIEQAQGNALSLYVQAAFEQVLGRQPDQASLASFVNALQNGMSRTTFAMTLTHSSEYYDDVISQAYQHFLGRAPDAQGLQYWNQQLQAGLTDEQLEAQFIGSPEYYQHSGGTDKAWVDHMYFDLLGRAPDVEGETYWVTDLAGGASRSLVALGFAASAEREGDHVKEDYEIYLGRLPTQSEIDGWVTAFEQGMTNEDVFAGFIAADEYFNDHS